MDFRPTKLRKRASKVKKGSKHKEPKVLEENLGAIKLVRDVPNRPGQKAYNPSYPTVPSAPTSAQSEPQAVASGTAVSTTPGLSREVPASAEPVGLSVEPSMSKEVVGKDKAKPMPLPGKQKATKDDKKLPDTKELIPKSPMETARSDPATAKEPQKSKEKPQKIMNPVDELATPPQAKRKVVEKMKEPEKEKQEKPAARKVMSKEPKVVIKEPTKEEKKPEKKESKTKVRTPPQKQTKKPESASFELAKEAPMKSVEQVTRRDATPNSGDVLVDKEDIKKKWDNFMEKMCDRDSEFILNEYRIVRTYLPPASTRQGFDRNCEHNRFIDMVCIDHTRVEVSTGDYIHANWVELPSKGQLILTQLPLLQSAATFWLMVLEHNVQGIALFLTDYEAQLFNASATFPSTQDFLYYAQHRIRVGEFKRVNIQKNWTMHVLSVSNGDKKRFIHVHHYTDWAHKENPTDIVDLWRIQSVFRKYSSPHVYVSLSGCGRAGAFATLQAAHENMHLPNKKLSVGCSMQRVRNGRAHAIQRLNQFRAVHVAIGEHIIGNGCMDLTPQQKANWEELVNDTKNAE